jgi:hypothetical protein
VEYDFQLAGPSGRFCAYLQRVGADAVNFRKARVVREINGYPKEIGYVTFKPDGTIALHGEIDQPTDSEASAHVAGDHGS